MDVERFTDTECVQYSGARVERIIKMLKRYGYEFVTFAQLAQIMSQEQAA